MRGINVRGGNVRGISKVNIIGLNSLTSDTHVGVDEK